MARPERTPIVNGINKDDKAAAILETCLLNVLGCVKENDENQNEKKKERLFVSCMEAGGLQNVERRPGRKYSVSWIL